MARPADSLLTVKPLTAIVRRARASRRLRALLRNRSMVAGLTILAAYGLVAVLANEIAPASPFQSFPGSRLSPPSAAHWFGTDDFGRDVFSRVVYASRISITVGLAVSLITTLFGGFLGLLAGYYRLFDRIVMRTLDGLMAFPGILLAIAISGILKPSVETVVVALSIVYTPYAVRVLRAPVLANREAVYVEAARCLGAQDWRILALHILPNSVQPLLVQSTFIFSFAVLAEATLSFLGLGVPPPTPTWGGMLNDGKIVMVQAPWLIWGPGSALVLITLALNMVGDGLRDLLDPRSFTLQAQGFSRIGRP
ncbi:MAG: peptide ABC transporter permease [Chloroflexota bacterium]